ncbi:S-phase kinase-associated protein 2 isoform X2 [Diachasma alloeum]|uniref:S-phase kinase-associated protein 2 isoform X2 n=1 Tax=Diachasma alloeum TaxID=454923 RepID=UPI0007382B05|nr:S-phase kinase-associated protein 2 isoform X2 [Diachasma alloeum]
MSEMGDDPDVLPWWKSKRMRLDDGCNNNLNSSLNNGAKSGGKWKCPGDTSIVEPEVMVDLGVSMLDDETSCDSMKRSQSQDCSVSPSSLVSARHAAMNENILMNEKENLYRGSKFEKGNLDRLEQDPHALMDDPTSILNSLENESGYATRVEAESSDEKLVGNFSTSTSNSDVSGLDQFYLFRRRKRGSFVGEDKFSKLSDEMILMILKWLPKKCLVRSMLVCKRWCQIARDEALWSRLDLGGKVLSQGTLGHILPRGVQILRLAQAELADPVFSPGSEVLGDGYMSKLQYLDLSMSVISADGLAELLCKCRLLKKLSLEKCTLNGESCRAISQNRDITVLNLTMCEGIDAQCVRHLIKLSNLTALNMSWCSLDSDSITLLCRSLPRSITRLNISGCRKTMTDKNVRDLVATCPDLVELDLSDCTLLTIRAINSFLTLHQLEHLSLSRCYGIPLSSSYARLTHMPSLLYLDIFGLMTDAALKSFQANCNSTEINKFLYSSVARPTVGVRRTSIWGLRVRD